MQRVCKGPKRDLEKGVNHKVNTLRGNEAKWAYARAMLRMRFDNTCASSLGGPGRNLEEHIAGRSTLGTV